MITCWGTDGIGDCDETLKGDGDLEEMEAAGWGWLWAEDAGAASGMGYYFACPHHRQQDAGGNEIQPT